MKHVLLLSLLILASCASNPHKVEVIETKMSHVTEISTVASIGVKDGNMVYQKHFLIGEELRSIQNKSYELEAQLYGGPRYYDNNGMIGVLKSCRKKLSQLADGKLMWVEKRDYVIPEYETMKIGLTENGKLTAVTEEFLKDRLERFKGYKHVLEERIDEMDEKIKICEAELAFKANTNKVAKEY